MKPHNLSKRDCEGKGIIGCMLSIILMGTAILLVLELGPVYYSNYTFKKDINDEISRAGARNFDNETVIKNVMDLATKNEVPLKKEDIQVERFAGQIHVELRYAVPVDLALFKRGWKFEIRASGFIGAQ